MEWVIFALLMSGIFFLTASAAECTISTTGSCTSGYVAMAGGYSNVSEVGGSGSLILENRPLNAKSYVSYN